ncbi:MAG: MarR family winged helix-turn-helix transcriptional regulator [Acidimicrobiales bacterium]
MRAEETAAGSARLAELVAQIGLSLRRRVAARLEPLGLTYGQARALRMIARAGRVRMADLATLLGVVPRSVTGMVDALESRELVARCGDPADRRSVLVCLTTQGCAALAEMESARRVVAEEVFAALRPRERDQLETLLERLDAGSSCRGPGCTAGGGR